MNISVPCAGLIHVTTTSSKSPIRYKTPQLFRLTDCNKLYINGITTQTSITKGSQLKCSASFGSNLQGSTFNNSQFEPFWVSFLKDIIGGLKSLVVFLAQQPGQLKHIEWPSFQSTLKTAALTLVLVAMLIVALSTVDAGLCYVLALLLRKPA